MPKIVSKNITKPRLKGNALVKTATKFKENSKVASKNKKQVEGTEVSSQNLKKVEYNHELKQLTIVFNRMNRTYNYFNVPYNTYKRLISASSQGEYFHKFIKFRFEYAETSKKTR